MAALDSRELVLRGLQLALAPQLAGLVVPQNIHASWQDANLAGAIGTGATQQPALVILDLGNEAPQNPQPIQNERTVTLLPGNLGPGVLGTQIVADQSQVAPLTITCVGAGEQGRNKMGLLTATVKAALGGAQGTYTILLPDDNVSVPATFASGLTATLIRNGGRVHTADPIRQFYAFSITHQVSYSDYHTETPVIATQIVLRESFTEGVSTVNQTITISTPPS